MTDTDTADSLNATAKQVGITVIPPPSLNVPTAVSVNENATFTFSSPNAISVTDMAGTGNDNETMTLSVSHGTLSLGTQTGLTVSGNGTAASPLTLSGTLSALNADLPTLVYTPTSSYSGPDILSVTDTDTTDDLSAVSKQVGITVNPVNSPPSLNVPAAVSLNENRTLTFSSPNAISVTDTAGAGNNNETLTLTVSHGTLGLGTQTGLTVSGNGTSGSPLTLSGTLSALNSDLASLAYTPGVGDFGSDSLSLNLKDTTDNLTDTTSVAISVNVPADVWEEASPNAFTDGLTVFEQIVLGGNAQGSQISGFFPGATAQQTQNALNQLDSLYNSSAMNVWGETSPNAFTDGLTIFEDILLGGKANASQIEGFFPGATQQQIQNALTALANLYPTGSSPGFSPSSPTDPQALLEQYVGSPGLAGVVARDTLANLNGEIVPDVPTTFSGTQTVSLVDSSTSVSPSGTGSFDVNYEALNASNAPVNSRGVSFYIFFDPNQITLTAPVIPTTDPLYNYLVAQPSVVSASSLGVSDPTNPADTELILVQYASFTLSPSFPGNLATLFSVSYTASASFSGSTSIDVIGNANAQDPDFPPLTPSSLVLSAATGPDDLRAVQCEPERKPDLHLLQSQRHQRRRHGRRR